MEIARFIRGLFLALGHAFREMYYAVALNHVGPAHPDAWLLTMRMLNSRRVVNDFLNERL